MVYAKIWTEMQGVRNSVFATYAQGNEEIIAHQLEQLIINGTNANNFVINVHAWNDVVSDRKVGLVRSTPNIISAVFRFTWNKRMKVKIVRTRLGVFKLISAKCIDLFYKLAEK